MIAQIEGRHLLITGGTGYIGSALVALALAKGCTVTLLGRSQPSGTQSDRLRYARHDLGAPLPAGVLSGIHAVVHLAADTSSGADRLAESVEINAGRALFTAASTQGCRFLFVSSQSARVDAPAPYGRIKWHVEHAVLQGGGYVIRPGLVYGGREAGLFGALVQLVRRWPVLPDLRPPPWVQPLHLNDLCLALLLLACDPEAEPGTYALGAPQGISFTEFLKAIALDRVRRPRLFLPLPARLLTALPRLRRICPWLPDPGSERLLGLAALQPMATQASLCRLGLELRPLSAGMARGAAQTRRHLAWEGYALLSYATGRKASPAMVKRYVRGVTRLDKPTTMALPIVFLRWPQMLRLLDGNQRLLNLYGWRQMNERLALAVALAEASPAAAAQFLQLRPRRAVSGGLTLFGLMLKESAVKPLQWGYFLFALILPRRK